MARYLGPKAKLSRREGTDLFLKSARRSISDKAKFDSKPGQHGRTSGSRTSDYGMQLREKQKVKRMYGLSESQFRNTYIGASRLPGVKGTNLLVALETRLDNIVYRMGFASSRRGARQLVGHGHVEVNGRKVDIPSYHVVPGQEVRVAPKDREQISVKLAQEYASRGAAVSWISIDAEKAAGRLLELPTRDAIPVNATEQLIVELYSK